MNILLITTRLNFGGIAVYTVSLAKALKQRGNKVLVASSGGPLIDELKREEIEHIKIPVDTSADVGIHTIASYLKLSRIIDRDNIELIHAQTRVTQVIAGILSRRKGKAFVSTCHGFFKNRWFRRAFPCWGLRAIAISEAVREHMINDLNIPKEDTRLIYNGIEVNRYLRPRTEDEKSRIRKEYGLKATIIIGVISRLSEVKGHIYLFRAFAKLLREDAQIQLLIVGDGKREYPQLLKDEARRLNIEESVIFAPARRDTSVPLSVMDIFCLPTLEEGLGLSVIEAMAAGVPVVASGVGGINSLIKNGENGILAPPGDEEALAKAISSLLADKDRAQDMAEKSRKLVFENFTVDNMTDKVLKVYEEAKNQKDKV